MERHFQSFSRTNLSRYDYGEEIIKIPEINAANCIKTSSVVANMVP